MNRYTAIFLDRDGVISRNAPGKPDPRIFNAALASLCVTADDSIFVDDCLEEADGARQQGFTSFHMDRTLIEPDFNRWEIGSLEHLLEWLETYGRDG